MAPRKRYRLDRVTVEPGEQRASTWTFGRKPVVGRELAYTVRDANFPSRNEWEFVVRIPNVRDGRIEVRPITTPTVKVWAELPDRSLNFSRATVGDARGKLYCKVALADPTGERSRDVIRSDERGELPSWFDPLKGRMRLKQKVRTTKGNDGEDLVVLVRPDDHETMIRLFFAMKVWVLKERIAL